MHCSLPGDVFQYSFNVDSPTYIRRAICKVSQSKPTQHINMCARLLHTLLLLVTVVKYTLAATSFAPFANNTRHSPANTTAVPYKVQVPPLDTPWTHLAGQNPWPDHPRPQLKRQRWQSLNGIWTFQSAGNMTSVSETDVPLAPLEQETLIPSCIESALSGLQILDTMSMWFATTFEIPPAWEDQHVLLNLEAVDYESTIFINGIQASFHRGGYSRNTIDITDLIQFDEPNDL